MVSLREWLIETFAVLGIASQPYQFDNKFDSKWLVETFEVLGIVYQPYGFIGSVLSTSRIEKNPKVIKKTFLPTSKVHGKMYYQPFYQPLGLTERIFSLILRLIVKFTRRPIGGQFTLVSIRLDL